MAQPVSLVVGASSRIGTAIAGRLLGDPSRCWLTYHSDDSDLRDAVTKMDAGERAQIRRLDVGDQDMLRSLMEEIEATDGRIDHLVVNPSFSDPDYWKRHLTDVDADMLRSVFEVDVIGSFNVVRAAWPLLEKSDRAAIVTFSSASSHKGDPNGFVYNPAQMGVVGLTRSVARQGAPNIRCNAIAPGAIAAEWADDWLDEDDDLNSIEGIDRMPKRLGKPEEIAEAVAFLLDPKSAYINGQTLFVDGGVSLL